MSDHEHVYPQITAELARQRSRIAPAQAKAFRAFSETVFADGAIPAGTKQLIAVAVAHVTQCPYCIRSHTVAAIKHGATAGQIMEAIWIAAEMRAGALMLIRRSRSTPSRALKARSQDVQGDDANG